MINRVVLVGRMTRDPELRRTQQGDAVTSFTLAVNRNFTSGDGQQILLIVLYGANLLKMLKDTVLREA